MPDELTGTDTGAAGGGAEAAPSPFEAALASLGDDGKAGIDTAAAVASAGAATAERTEAGRFAGKEGKEGKEAAKGVPADVAAALAGEADVLAAAVKDPPAAAEPAAAAAAQEPAAADAAAVAEPAAEPAAEPDPAAAAADPAAADPAAADPAEDLFTLSVPGRKDGDPDLAIPVAGLAREERELLSMMRNTFMRREALDERESQVQSNQDELEEIRDHLRDDPAGFFLEHVPDETLGRVAEAILARLWAPGSKVADHLSRLLNQWDESPEKRQAFLDQQTSAAADRAAGRIPPEIRRNARRVERAVDALVPESATAAQKAGFVAAARGALRAHILSAKVDQLDPATVPSLLQPLLTGYGFAPAAGGAPGGVATRGPVTAAAAAPGTPAAAATTGTRLAQASVRRRAAAVVTPAGPVAATAAPVPPAGQTVEDRLKWYNEH